MFVKKWLGMVFDVLVLLLGILYKNFVLSCLVGLVVLLRLMVVLFERYLVMVEVVNLIEKMIDFMMNEICVERI